MKTRYMNVCFILFVCYYMKIFLVVYHMWKFGCIITNGYLDIAAFVKIAAILTYDSTTKQPLVIIQPHFHTWQTT